MILVIKAGAGLASGHRRVFPDAPALLDAATSKREYEAGHVTRNLLALANVLSVGSRPRQGVHMITRRSIPLIVVLLLVALFIAAPMASADASHARVIRLSMVQGDVRFATGFHGDPLTDPNAVWTNAELNLPIRQGYVVATDNGRAEVEFEYSSMAFLKENSVLEFYDLSLHDGNFTTRLILRQGSASFYVNPSDSGYFSVTGGDFTVEANGRSAFRLNNFDDGSTVETLRGHVTVLLKGQTKYLEKGQSLSMKAGDEASLTVGRVPQEDEFDRWVSARIDTVSSATNSAMQYTASPYDVPGFADLYTYGSWFNCGGFGYGWRPFGVGLGWSPFAVGQWIMDPTFGWTYLSSQPWGWAPYHYGGWLFDSSCGGWFYSPPYPYGFFGGPGRRFPPRIHPIHPPRPVYRPVTAVFVRKGGTLGIVPMHPLDQNGKTPLNLEHGVFSPSFAKGATGALSSGEPGAKWQAVKSAPREAFGNSLSPAPPPARVSRTVLQGDSGVRVVSLSKESSIAYDPREHRFVNANVSAAEFAAAKAKEIGAANGPAGTAGKERGVTLAGRTSPSNSAVPTSARASEVPRAPRSIAPPPPAHSSGGGSYGGRSGGGSTYSGGGRSSGSSSGGSSSHPSSSGSAGSGGGGRAH